MALQISQYVDPGVYLQEVIVPGATNVATLPVLPTIIAHGSRTKRAVNEAVIRGLVSGESLTGFVAVTSGSTPPSDFAAAHRETLATRGNRRLENTTVYADGVAVSDAFLSYAPATILGTAAGTFNFSATGAAFCIQMDGNLPLTIRITSGVSAAPTVSGAQVSRVQTFATPAAATRAEVVSAINAALGAATNAALGVTSGGYGTAYAAVATDGTTGLRIVSPISGASSDVRIFAAQSDSGYTITSTTLFGAASLDADTRIDISDTVWNSAATYTVDYVSIVDYADSMVYTSTFDSIVRVGAYAGVGTFSEDTDFEVVTGTLDWDNLLVAASVTGVAFDATSGISGTAKNITVSIDGGSAITLNLFDQASPPHGYTASPNTAAEVVGNINAMLANNINYGARFNGVASSTGADAAAVITLTSPSVGTISSVEVTTSTTLPVTTPIFGALSLSDIGEGSRPDHASTYFVTYQYDRPSTDYNVPRQFFTPDSAYAFTGPLSEDNPLAVAVDVAFANRAPSILLVQVDDASAPGTPTTGEYQSAIDATEAKSTATDICVLSTSLAVQTYLMQHVEAMSSATEKNYRRGWFGMARDTAIGDRDTAGSYVYRARRTLQVAPTSPGRGRLLLVASPGIEGISKTITKEDGTTAKMDLDSTWLALAIAARMSAFSSPAEALARKTIAGFDTPISDDPADQDFTPWVRAERAALASAGVTVVTFDAGRYILLDPITTERGGGALISFEQPSASVQKDNISRKVAQALDSGVVGIVPVDLTDFILDIKSIIANVLAGEIGSGAIGPFRDSAGNVRGIDMSRDIIVEQDPNDPTKFFFKYFFNLRYPALRLFGEWSVDNPFFAA